MSRKNWSGSEDLNLSRFAAPSKTAVKPAMLEILGGAARRQGAYAN